MQVYFTDYFKISPEFLEDHGALNISLINDLPVFVDPFLLFNSEKQEYKDLHDAIIDYLSFLRERSSSQRLGKGLIEGLFLFPEVKQNWLGYSKVGNRGSGLGKDFANSLNQNLTTILNNFGEEEVTTGSHLEKVCLVANGVGTDKISDFTTNLIKGFLCRYTEKFSKKHLDDTKAKIVSVSHVDFNYKTQTWMSGSFYLPFIDGDYILLTPKDILSKDEAWINKADIVRDFDDIASSIPNHVLRDQINDYFTRSLPDWPTQKERNEVAARTALHFPEFIDYYIRFKEDNGDKAERLSDQKIKEIEELFIKQAKSLIDVIASSSKLYDVGIDTFDETYKRVLYLKHVIENNDGYRIFYVKGQAVKRESDLQLLFRLVWFASPSDVNSEVNNGRGPVDYKISRGGKDKTLVEFKLASNSQLKRNLEKQVEIYEEANQTSKSIKVILYFSESEYVKVHGILKSLDMKQGKNLVLIDACQSNKPSASKA
jgi:hypothetical protein